MTILCDVCGCENHLDQDSCEVCGHPIKKNVEYIICSTCGLSNPSTAMSCVGCSEPLNRQNIFSVEPIHDDSETHKIEAEFEPSVLIPNKIIKKRFENLKKFSKQIKVGLAIFAGLVVVVLITNWILGEPIYLESEDGFFYISNTNELILVNEKNDMKIIMSNINTVDQLQKFGDHVYFNSQNILYHYYKNDLNIVSENVTSYKVDFTGKRVLYTTASADSSDGDLYVYEERVSKRIDAKVGKERFVFGEKKSDIYYVSDITSEENLGVLFVKKGDEAPTKIADDVFAPVFSFKNDSVYFVRKDIQTAEKFELYLASEQRVTEIGRNIIHMLVNPKSDEVLLVQQKNDVTTLLWNRKEDIKQLDSDISDFGMYTFGDLNQALIYSTERHLLYNKNEETFYLNDDKVTKVPENLQEFYLSEDEKTIFIEQKDELSKGSFKNGQIEDLVSVASEATFIKSSKSGAMLIAKSLDHQLVLIHKGVEKDINASEESFLFSDNEKYIVYIENGDGYAYKLGANEPVYLGENITKMILIDQYIYTLVDDVLYRYKLGRFSSTKELDTMKYWSEFDPLY